MRFADETRIYETRDRLLVVGEDAVRARLGEIRTRVGCVCARLS